jgi:hypothetical protein
MKTLKKLAAVCVALATFYFSTVRANSDDFMEAQSALNALLADLETGRVQQMTVFFTQYEKSTRTRITPSALEVQSDKTFRTPLSTAPYGLMQTLKEMHLRPQEKIPDLRWGLIFLDASGKRLHSIYLDGRYISGTGRTGYIDGIRAGFDGSLSSWLEKEYLK